MTCRAIVTGASSGIGAAVVRKYSAMRYNVLGLSRSTGFDVSSKTAWDALCEKSGRCFDDVVLNAGVMAFSYDEESVMSREILHTNLMGVYYGLDAALRLVNPGGVVIVVSSACHDKPCPETPIYAASKAGVHSMISSFQVRYGSRIRVFGVSPGYVSTNLGGQGGDIPLELTDATMLGRPMSADEIAECIWSLRSGFLGLYGTDVRIDGGQI